MPDKRIKEVIDHAVQHSPSQSARMIVLTGQSHDQLWDITRETLRKNAGDKDFEKTEEKMKLKMVMVRFYSLKTKP